MQAIRLLAVSDIHGHRHDERVARQQCDWRQDMIDEMAAYCRAAGTCLEHGTARALLIPITDAGFRAAIETGNAPQSEMWHGPNLLSFVWFGEKLSDLTAIGHQAKNLIGEGAMFGWHFGKEAHVWKRIGGRLRRIKSCQQQRFP